MAREFRLPDIGEGLTEADIVRWLVVEGEHVEADQPIVEIETDKAVVEIPSPYAGIVLRHGGAEGETIAVGSVLVVIGEALDVADDPPESDSGPESVPDGEDALQTAFEPPSPTEPAAAPPIVGTLSEEAEVISSTNDTSRQETHSVKALPVVRKLARDNDIDLESVTGSGPDGRITRDDVEKAMASKASDGLPEPKPAEPATSYEVSRGEDERRQMSRLRLTIAANMSRSWAEVPHVTTFDEVDATRVLEVRSALSERHGIKIPLEALVIRAVIPALQAFPEFNAKVDGEYLVIRRSHDIGVAVDTSEGLMVAVVRSAADKGIIELAEEIRLLGEGAKQRTLTLDQLTGQSFTVSNIGALGGGHGTPIVPPGTTAILSVGRARMKPIVYDGDLGIAPIMPLSLSYDHRVIDGGQGRRFMSLLMENLEEPALFLAG